MLEFVHFSSLASFNLTDSENGRAYQSKIALDNCRIGGQYVISQGACEGAARDDAEHLEERSGCEECTHVRTMMDTWKRNISDVVLFVLVQVGRFGEWLYAALFAIRRIFGDLTDRLVYRLTDMAVEKVADEKVLLHVVQALYEVLFGGQPPTVSSEQELRLRAELAQRRIEECLSERLPSILARVIGQRELRVSLSRAFTCIQLPRLNKQLAYVLLDVLVERIRSQTSGAGTPMHYD
ncbi:PXA domain-containing protein [Aphelenchoides avenae]|nr:PXA domain-containing protein [Aphelenchus avenae]